jgi:hypothetical protein
MLVVRRTDGVGFAHSVDSIRRGLFVLDSLVVVTAGGTEAHGLSAIRTIEFVWEPEAAAVEEPNMAAGIVRIGHLFQNQPNPLSSETRIAFDLPMAGPVELVIYSVNGRFIRRLVKATREAGRHTANWDGRDDAGVKVGSGIYFYQLVAPGVEESRRMILLP